MALAQISIRDHVFISLPPIESILKETSRLLSKDNFDGEIKIFALCHLCNFN